jgi:hypothetical protein
MLKNLKRTLKQLHKKGALGKVVVIISSLALLASAILPYVL